MKADELQIGDWVQNPLGLVGRVQSIKYMPKDPGDEYGDYYYVTLAFGESYQSLDIKNVQPIPLTPEILEKNGLALDRLGNYFPEDKRYDLEISEIEGDIYWTICWGDHSILRLRFVHELQHCLRLTGIEKEIAL